jgi:excisionase family DNA binding protein
MTSKTSRRPRSPDASAKLSYSIAAACEATDLSRTRLFAAIADGSLASFRIGKRRMIPANALQDYINMLATAGEAAA